MVEKRVTRPCAVERHPKCKQIAKELAEGKEISTLSKKYKINEQGLRFYRDNRMAGKMVRAAQQRDITDAAQLFQIVLKAVQRMEKLSDACDEYLTDPKRPDSYFMGPQAAEIDVIWFEEVETARGVQMIKHRDSLQSLLANLDKHGIHPMALKSSITDPRVLLVKSSETLTKQMETLVNAWRAIDQGKNTFLGTPAWNQVVQIILKATDSDPEIRRRISDGLSKITS